jgi:hypothetical protein
MTGNPDELDLHHRGADAALGVHHGERMGIEGLGVAALLGHGTVFGAS